MKKILFILALMASTSVWAEKVTVTYCDGELGLGLGMGTSSVSSVQFCGATYFPKAKFLSFAGSQLTQLRYGFYSKENVESVTLWVRENLAGQDIATITVDMDSLKNGWNEFQLKTPISIDGTRGYYIGYTFTQARNTNSYFITVTGTGEKGVSFAKTPDGWCDLYDGIPGYSFGYTNIEAVLQTPELPEYGVKLSALTQEKEQYFCGDSVKVSGKVDNISKNTVTSLDIDFIVPDDETGTKTLTRHYNMNVATGSATNFYFTFKADYTQAHANDTIKAHVAKINGVSMTESFENSGILSIYKTKHPRNLVIEEATSVKCGFCPRGIVAAEEILKKYGDRVIPISVHSSAMGSDPMVVTTYASKVSVDGLPGATYNRVKDYYQHVSTDYYDYYYQVEEDRGAIVDFDFTVTRSNRTCTCVTTAQLDFDKPNVDYRMAYAVIEDSVIGTTGAYNQINSYAGGAGGAMGGFEKKSSPISYTEMVYNEVARGIYPTFLGYKASLTDHVVAGETYTHTQGFNIPNTVKEDKFKNVSIVAMLLNGKTGEILQGKIIHAKDFIDGIEDIDDDDDVDDDRIYNLQGQIIKHPTKGNIYIVKGKKVLY